MRAEAAGILLLVGMVLLISAGVFALIVGIENHPDHMTQNEQNATIKRIEKKLDILIERGDRTKWEGYN